jgi:endonuclease YncB( thermonuclease family)
MRIILAAFLSVAITAPALAIDICSGGNREARKVTCLVDGDTGWHGGVKWRLLDIDTPEYAPHAECPAETFIAAQSTERMRELMRGGYVIEDSGRADRNDRALVIIRLPDGRDAGRVLIEEGLAVDWPHEPGVWCR